jgi:hypothetical protein
MDSLLRASGKIGATPTRIISCTPYCTKGRQTNGPALDSVEEDQQYGGKTNSKGFKQGVKLKHGELRRSYLVLDSKTPERRCIMRDTINSLNCVVHGSRCAGPIIAEKRYRQGSAWEKW